MSNLWDRVPPEGRLGCLGLMLVIALGIGAAMFPLIALSGAADATQRRQGRDILWIAIPIGIALGVWAVAYLRKYRHDKAHVDGTGGSLLWGIAIGMGINVFLPFAPKIWASGILCGAGITLVVLIPFWRARRRE